MHGVLSAMPLKKILDWVITALGFLILMMIVTGGTLVRFPHAKIEFSAIEPWALVVFTLLLVRKWLGGWGPWPSRFKKWIAFGMQLPFAATAASTLFVYYGVLGFFGHWARHASLKTFSFDLCFAHQPLFYAFSKPFLRCDLCHAGDFLSEHLAFTYFLIAPIVALCKSDEWIFFLQVVCVIAPLAALLWVGPLKKRREFIFWTALILLCNSPLRATLTTDFREDHLAFAFLVLAGTALYRAKVSLYFAALLAACLSKEHVGFVAAGFAAPILWDESLELNRKERRWIAAGTFFTAVGVTLVYFAWLLPYFQRGNVIMTERFPGMGSTPGQILWNLVSSPGLVIKMFFGRLFEPASLKYFIYLIGPYALFLWRSRFWALAALPGILMNLLSAQREQLNFFWHYQLILLAPLVIGVAAAVRDWPKKKSLALGILIAVALSGRWPGWTVSRYWPTQAEMQNFRYIQRLKPEGGIASSHYGLAHLSLFPHIAYLRFPKTGVPADRLEAWEKISELNWDKNGVDRLLVDVEADPAERVWADFLVGEAPARGWDLVSRSPNGRFIYLVRR